MRTIIVTGGAGFIGCNFVRYALAQTNYKVVVIDKLTYAGSLSNLDDVSGHDRYSFVYADIGDPSPMRRVFEDHKPVGILNFAAETHVDRSIDDPSPFVDTNVSGTCVLLEVARRYVAELPQVEAEAFRFLHVSTDEVYGTLGDEGLFHETTPYAPNSPYAASKAAADHFVRAYFESYGLKTVITNCSNNYGPYQFPEKLIPLMLLNALDAKPLPIYGDGSNIRDWLYVEDHCEGIMLALEKGVPGEKYNIGGNNERTNLQLVDKLCEILDELRPAVDNPEMARRGLKSYAELKTFVEDRPGHDKRYAIDAQKIREDLGWEPRYGFDHGLPQTVEWYLGNLAWCAEVQSRGYARERLGLRSV